MIAALLAGGGPAAANDAAASIAAGGIVLREERHVSMRKEQLSIALGRVTVEYEFVNESSSDVTTEVAFPVPEYRFQFDSLGGPIDLGGFRAWVDGREIRVARLVRALANGVDHAPVLRGLGIDVERHGNYDPTDWSAPGRPNQIRALSRTDFDRLVSLGLIEAASPAPGWPRWKVAITWHWNQTFPAGKVVRVRHEYTPAAGFRGYWSAASLRSLGADFPEACVDAATMRTLQRKLSDPTASGSRSESVVVSWVNYVLTTANTWKTPIEQFELVVERPERALVSFCWDGKVEKMSPTRFRAMAKDFVPTAELTVLFAESR